MLQEADDIAVIKLVLQGQQSAFATLVERYQQYVFTLVMRYVNDRELAEELAQDVFVKAYRYLADFKGNSKFSTWLYTIVNSTCLSQLRKKKDGTILLEEEKMIALADSISDENPLHKMQLQSRKLMLYHAIRQLPDEDGQILTLFYHSEQSMDEIGVIMGLTVTNVKGRLFRARQKLRDILSPTVAKNRDAIRI